MAAVYKRNQVEEALWRLFAQEAPGSQPDKVFRTRIKRLLELDRKEAGEGQPLVFVDAVPEGQGKDVPYTLFNVFCLGIGLSLVDCGFKQGEVTFLLQHVRHHLEEAERVIRSSPPAPRQYLLPQDRPDAPTFKDKDVVWADCRVFMIFRKVEIKESMPGLSAEAREKPVIADFYLLKGVSGLSPFLDKLGFGRRQMIILEVAEMYVLLESYLEDARPRRRGPGG